MSDEDEITVEQREEIRKQKSELLQNQQVNDLRDMLMIPSGVRFLKRVFHNAQIYHDAHTGNSTTYYNLGFKRFGLNLAADLRLVRKIGTPTERDIIAEIMLDDVPSDPEPKLERH